MANNLPWDLIEDVLCRMHVKDLLRFRSVSKFWCSSIGDPNFIEKYLKRSLETYSGMFILKGRGSDVRLGDASNVHLGDRPDMLVGDDTYIPTELVDHPLMGVRQFNLVGYCHGLLAMRKRTELESRFHSLPPTLEQIIIWNPSTKMHINVPIPPRSQSTLETSIVGFGFDGVNEDYKLLMSMDNRGQLESFPIEIMVYSVKDSVWKKICELSDEQVGRNVFFFCAYRANALHWIAIRHASVMIVAYDLATEKFRDMALPENQMGMKVADLGHYGLGVVLIRRNPEEKQWVIGLKVWVMQEYGLDNSWTELIDINFPTPIHSIIRLGGDIGPVGQLVSRDRFLFDINGTEFILYDIKGLMFKIVRFTGAPSWRDVRFCIRSLVGFERGRGGTAAGAGQSPAKPGARRGPELGPGKGAELVHVGETENKEQSGEAEGNAEYSSAKEEEKERVKAAAKVVEAKEEELPQPKLKSKVPQLRQRSLWRCPKKQPPQEFLLKRLRNSSRLVNDKDHCILQYFIKTLGFSFPLIFFTWFHSLLIVGVCDLETAVIL